MYPVVPANGGWLSTNRRIMALLVVVASLSACAAPVWPVRSARIEKVETSWSVVYVHDGQEYDRGFFGGGLEDAVASNPAAEDKAQSYRRKHTAAQLFGIAAGGCAGGWMAQTGFRRGEFYSDGSIVLAGCAVVGLVTTLIFERLANGEEAGAIDEYNRPFQDPATER
jgi:hypothetical protein